MITAKNCIITTFVVASDVLAQGRRVLVNHVVDQPLIAVGHHLVRLLTYHHTGDHGIAVDHCPETGPGICVIVDGALHAIRVHKPVITGDLVASFSLLLVLDVTGTRVVHAVCKAVAASRYMLECERGHNQDHQTNLKVNKYSQWLLWIGSLRAKRATRDERFKPCWTSGTGKRTLLKKQLIISRYISNSFPQDYK